jgi:hypothetical protein
MIFENFYFFVWVPNSEERKSNLRNPYLGVLVRIIELFYFGGGLPASRSASAYTASSSMSGYESTVSPIINLN